MMSKVGQTEQMKITKIADQAESRIELSAGGIPGERRDRLEALADRIERAKDLRRHAVGTPTGTV